MLYAISSSDTRDVVWTGDGAVDTAQSDVVKYLETLDKAHLIFRPDMVPTRFTVAALDSMQAARADMLAASLMPPERRGADDPSIPLAYLIAHFRMGVREIRNLESEGDCHTVNPKLGMSDELFAKIHPAIVGRVAQEIGVHVFSLTRPPADPPLGADEGK